MSSSSILSNLPSFNKQSFSRANSRSSQRPPTTYFCTAETSKPQCIITLEKTSILHRHFEKLERQQQQLLQQQQQQQQVAYTTTHYQQQQVSIDNNSTIITPSPLSSSVPLSNVLLPSSNNSHHSLDVNATSSKRPTVESLVEERPNKTQKLTLNSDVSSSTAPHLQQQQYPNDE